VIGQRVLAQGGEDADEQGKDDDDDLRRHHQQQRVGHAVPDHLPGRLAALHQRHAEVAAQDAAARAGCVGHAVAVQVDLSPVVADEPVEVLHIHRLVEAQLARQALAVGRACHAAAAHRRHRVAHLAHQREENDADEEQQWNGL
jgi:hypothetical protein